MSRNPRQLKYVAAESAAAIDSAGPSAIDTRGPVTASAPNRFLFREVNERIRDVNEAFSLGAAFYELVCECDACSCTSHLNVPREVYERVRLDPDRFLVIAGHEHDDRLVAGADGYSVVALEATVAAGAAG